VDKAVVHVIANNKDDGTGQGLPMIPPAHSCFVLEAHDQTTYTSTQIIACFPSYGLKNRFTIDPNLFVVVKNAQGKAVGDNWIAKGNPPKPNCGLCNVFVEGDPVGRPFSVNLMVLCDRLCRRRILGASLTTELSQNIIYSILYI
jgi:hypothetical protein